MKSIAEIKAAINCPIPSISTPFLENGDIDWAGVDRIVDFEIENGAKSLLITNGDSLLTILAHADEIDSSAVPPTSLIREFIGGGEFEY